MLASEFDLAVIGAGPAGAACALAAARARLRVLLVDPQGEAFDKPCGEGLMPSGVAALTELGLESISSEALAFRHLRFVLAGRSALDFELDAPARALSRPALLRALSAALRDQPAVVRVTAHARAVPAARGFELSLACAGSARSIVAARASVLVAADGSGGGTAPWLRGRPPARRSKRCGIRARFELAEPLDRVEIHMGSGAEVYLTPLPGGLVNVAVLLETRPAGVQGADALCRWALSVHPAARSRLGARITSPSARALDRPAPGCVARADAFLIGDAAGAVDPILGCGVSLALASGIAAARAAEARRAGDRAEDVAARYRATWRAMATTRTRLARTLRFLAAHPRLAAGCLEILRRSPRLRRRVCRAAAGTTPPRAADPRGSIAAGRRAIQRALRG